MHDLHDLLDHYGDLLRDTADILKKSRDLKNYTFYDKDSKPRQIKTIEDLKLYIKEEMNAYLESLDDF
jgi:hypothetical protein